MKMRYYKMDQDRNKGSRKGSKGWEDGGGRPNKQTEVRRGATRGGRIVKERRREKKKGERQR